MGGEKPYPATPALDKEKRAREKGHSQEIGEFLDWLISQGMAICLLTDRAPGLPTLGQEWTPTGDSTQRLLARYFDIDEADAERERAAVLAWVRENSEVA